MYIMKIYVPSMLPKGVETINKQTNKQAATMECIHVFGYWKQSF